MLKAETLKKERLEKKMSLKALAKKIGVSDTSIMKWEAGNHEPSIKNYEAWINALGIEMRFVRRRKK